MGFLIGLIMVFFGNGYLTMVTGLVGGLLADVILKKADYKSAKSTVLSCGVFSIWVFGNFAPIFLNRESYMVMLTEGYGAEYAATLNTYMPMWIAPILLVACFVFGLVGGVIGKAICKSTSSVPVLHNGAGNSAQQKTEQGLRLDPRTKLLLIFIISIFVMGGTGGEAMGLIRLVLCTVPAILLLTSKQCAKAVGYIAVFSAFYAVQIYVLPHLTGILNFLVLFTTGFFCRILPSVAIAAYAVKTTTVSELISGMERIHMPKEVTIPLTVMFRFFPTVFQESEAISDAMKMRGIKLGGKKSSKILEYKLIPMITCSVKIGEELSAAAITRGLGAPVKRTNICQLKFNFADVVLILFCCFVVFWAIASPIISAGGILP